MSNLYKDAIADARKLREAAEQNAKNRIIEAVTPQLRRMIERQISEGTEELLDDDMSTDLLDVEDTVDLLDDEIEPSEPAAEPMDFGMGSMDIDSDGLGSVEILPDEPEIDTKEYEDESQNKSVHVNITVEAKRNHLLRHRAIRLVKALSEAKTRKQRKQRLNEKWKQEELGRIGEERFRREYGCEFLVFDETLVNSIILSTLEGTQPIVNMGQTRWYKKMDAQKTYVIALDPAMGTGGDNAAIQVLELPTFEQVAEWKHNKTDVRSQMLILQGILQDIYDETKTEENIYFSLENNGIGRASIQSLEERKIQLQAGQSTGMDAVAAQLV